MRRACLGGFLLGRGVGLWLIEVLRGRGLLLRLRIGGGRPSMCSFVDGVSRCWRCVELRAAVLAVEVEVQVGGYSRA